MAEPKPVPKSKQRYFKDRKRWRLWLRKNYDKTDELWLVIYKQHTGKPCVSYEEAVEEALCYGWIDSVIRRLDDERYLQKFTPRTNPHNWSPTNRKRMERLIANKKMTKVGLARFDPKPQKRAPAPSPATLQKPPKFFTDALARNKAAREFYESLAPSYQRRMFGWVAAAKRETTRAKRMAEVMSLLRQKKTLGLK